jgi:hypothetical protein
MWKILPWPHHFPKRGGLGHMSSFSVIYGRILSIGGHFPTQIPKRNKQVSYCQFSNRPHKWKKFDEKIYLTFYFPLPSNAIFVCFFVVVCLFCIFWPVDTIRTNVVTGIGISSRNFPIQKIFAAEWLFSPTSDRGFLRKTKRSYPNPLISRSPIQMISVH